MSFNLTSVKADIQIEGTVDMTRIGCLMFLNNQLNYQSRNVHTVSPLQKEKLLCPLVSMESWEVMAYLILHLNLYSSIQHSSRSTLIFFAQNAYFSHQVLLLDTYLHLTLKIHVLVHNEWFYHSFTEQILHWQTQKWFYHSLTEQILTNFTLVGTFMSNHTLTHKEFYQPHS